MSEINLNGWNPSAFNWNAGLPTDNGLRMNFGTFGQAVPSSQSVVPTGFGTDWKLDQDLTNWGNTAIQNWNAKPDMWSWEGMKNLLLGGGAGDGTNGIGLWGKMTENGYAPGMVMQGLNAFSGLAGAWNGMQQLDLAKDQFAFQKRAYEQNYNNQKTLTNGYLRDRQARRIAEGTAQGTVDDYMKNNGIK